MSVRFAPRWWWPPRARGRREPDFAAIGPGSNAACLLNADPPIVLGWTGRLFRFGAASVIAPLFERRRFTFVLIAKGSVADAREAHELAHDAHAFMAAHAHHRFEWLCNADGETARLRALGLAAHTHNQNLFLREDVFRPLRRIAPAFDAVYNARISPEKRNELAARIGRVAFIAYRDPGEHDVDAFHAAAGELLGRAPGGQLVNRLTADGCRRLTPPQVNRVYARSHVGLCLSPREGAMRVAVEYQLAGLPIVATPCHGGRDHHLDPETWTIVPPDAQAVAGAVEALKARRLPREFVRARALGRIQHDRGRFVAFVQTLIDAEGGHQRFDVAFRRCLRRDHFERGVPMREFAREVWRATGGE